MQLADHAALFATALISLLAAPCPSEALAAQHGARLHVRQGGMSLR